jgi:PBP1b-binding outer membrane lipoprotein LpoB
MKKQILTMLALVAVLSSCSSYNYYSVSNKKLNPNYRTYAWLPEGKSKASSIYNNDIAADKIVEAASTELENRGFKLDNNRPDLLVRYTAVVNKETKSYNEPMYYDAPGRFVPRVGVHRGRAFYYYAYRDPFPVYVGNEQRTVRVKQGSIMIDLIDRKTSKVIWRGWAEGELDNPEKAIEQLPEVIGNIFKKLPV